MPDYDEIFPTEMFGFDEIPLDFDWPDEPVSEDDEPLLEA